MSQETEKKGVSRRTLVKGAAWAIPATPLVVAAPAYAVSPDCLTIQVVGCRDLTGSIKEYQLRLCSSCYSINITGLFSNAKELYTDRALTTSFERTLTAAEGCQTFTVYSDAGATWVYATYEHNGSSVTSEQFKTPPNSCTAA